MFVLPRELLPEIMTYWGGHRLGLTCRALNARMTDEYLSTFAREVTAEHAYYNQTVLTPTRYYTLSHYELPNGTFHGPANTSHEHIIYSRGRIIYGYDKSGVCNTTIVNYHGSWIVVAREYEDNADWWIRMECEDHIIDLDSDASTIIDQKEYDTALSNGFATSVFCNQIADNAARKWLDHVLATAKSLTGNSDFAVDVKSGRGKMDVCANADHVARWPDVNGMRPDYFCLRHSADT